MVEEVSAAYLVGTVEEDVPAGYKKTEVGVAPKDWNVGPFGELFEKTSSRKALRSSEVVSFVGMQDVTENARLKSVHLVNFEEVKAGFTYFEKKDVLVAKITPCFENGKGCSTNNLPTDVGVGSTEFHVLRANDSSDADFIYFWTTTRRLRTALESEMVGSAGHRRVPLHALQNYVIPYPKCKHEQSAIAKILSDLDLLMERLEILILKKQAVKAAAMQQLLTGRTRLPEFAFREDGSKKGLKNNELGEIPEDWIVHRLGKIASFINGRAYSLNEWETEGIPVIRLQNLTGRGDEYYFSNIELPEKNYCVTGDLLFMWSATFGPVIWQGERAIFHYHIWKVDVNEEFSRAFVYYLLCHMTLELKKGSSSGGTMLHVTKGMMEEARARLPSYEEQLAISAVLKDLDRELEALEGRLSKTRQLKQGMMQQLLTGKIRLVQPAKVRELIDES